MIGALFMLSTPLIAWGLVEIADKLGWLEFDYDPDADYEFDPQPFGGELR